MVESDYTITVTLGEMIEWVEGGANRYTGVGKAMDASVAEARKAYPLLLTRQKSVGDARKESEAEYIAAIDYRNSLLKTE